MVHSFLEFLIQNNVGIIQTLFGGLFLLLIFLIVRSFKEEKPAPAPVVRTKREPDEKAQQHTVEKKPLEMPLEASLLDDLDNLDDLVAADEKAHEAAAATAAGLEGSSAPAVGATAAAVPPSSEQKVELEKAISEKEKVIADLKSEMAAIKEKTATATAIDTSELEKKMKELQDKLSEYEIIEEDIANLSFYKNENSKLKDELQKLKETAALADNLEEVRPKNENPSESVPEAPTPTAAPAASDDLMEEFEKTVQQKETIEQALPAESKDSSDTDILKEFESVVHKELGGPAATVAATEPLAEASPAPVEAAPAASMPISEDIDTSKLLTEAEELAKAEVTDVPADDTEEESKQKLISEFENFINKAQ